VGTLCIVTTDAFEGELRRIEAEAESALRAATAVVRELKKVRATAATGQVRDLRRALERSRELAAEAVSATRDLRAGPAVEDAREYLTSGAYTKELLSAAAEAGVSVYEADDGLLCYPSLVRLLPGDEGVDIDGRRERRLRPSVLIAALAATQQAGPRFKPEPFLETLAAGYRLVLGEQGKPSGTVVRLVDLHRILTLLPGRARDYPKSEFARDLYLLDSSRHTRTKDGRVMSLSASTGTRQAGVLTTVSKGGERQRYWGIAFAAQPSPVPR
jgi:hypothetical protein